MIGKTLVLIKPEAVQRHLVGEIITRFEKAGLSILKIRSRSHVDDHLAREHYSGIEQKHGKKVFKRAVEHLKSGPVVAVIFTSFGDTVSVVRKIVGDTVPETASPGTIRGDFGSISLEYCDEKDISIPNLVHASSSNEDAEREIKIWFR